MYVEAGRGSGYIARTFAGAVQAVVTDALDPLAAQRQVDELSSAGVAQP